MQANNGAARRSVEVDLETMLIRQLANDSDGKYTIELRHMAEHRRSKTNRYEEAKKKTGGFANSAVLCACDLVGGEKRTTRLQIFSSEFLSSRTEYAITCRNKS